MRDTLPPIVLATLLAAACSSAQESPAPAQEQVPSDLRDPGESVAPAAPWDAPGFQSASSRDGTHVVHWRPLIDGQVAPAVPNNEHFELEVWLSSGGEPLPGMRLSVLGWMPEHGHGMIRRPVARDLGGGRYQIAGMLLHMGGRWQLFFDVIDGANADRTEFVLEL